ncbi:hypothetical protein EXIGLDRAFT_24275 [Exidia glandulosa HHB12029]|uniref:Uncharacterized protein n=1 Tax=Exidia glandulosa HHB12029 TaxID=1314781 RepID=A0A165R1T2_EXIGL|nr:hypothetical protein EXIGLDRAFT_24275 [Exidia glandulosa HHB12029]
MLQYDIHLHHMLPNNLLVGRRTRRRRPGIHIGVCITKHTLDHLLVFAPRELVFEDKRKSFELRVQLRHIILALPLGGGRLDQRRTKVDLPRDLRKHLAKTSQQSRRFGRHFQDSPNFQVLRAVRAIWPRRVPWELGYANLVFVLQAAPVLS